MKSNKIILGVVGGVTAVAVIGIGVFAFLRSQAASEARATMQQQASQLRKLFEKDVFPSQENIDTAEKNRDQTRKFVQDLRNEMKRGMVPVDRKKTPGDFSNIRMATIASLLEDAPVGTGDTKVVDNSQAPFQFGFDRYKEGVPAEKRDVPRLLAQLRMMDKLVRVLYDSGIVSLEAVAREEFEGGSSASSDASAEPATRTRGRAGRGRGTRTTASALVVTPPTLLAGAPEDLNCERFMFRFQTREAGLINVLNKLNEMRPFAVVSDLSFEKMGEDVVFPDEQKEAAASDAAKASARSTRTARGSAPAAEEPAAPAIRERPAPRTARLVSGPLRERPVRVTLTVDVYSILPPARQGSDEREED